jgi:hypothetical protein
MPKRSKDRSPLRPRSKDPLEEARKLLQRRVLEGLDPPHSALVDQFRR